MRTWTKCRNCGAELTSSLFSISGHCSRECAIEAYNFDDSECHDDYGSDNREDDDE